MANALRLTSKGSVVLALARHQDGVAAIFTDSEPGLPEGEESRLFEPFETFEPPGSASGPSTGLGLMITRGLARAMGGDLVFERPAGGGSRFRLTLAAPETEAARAPESAKDPASAAARLRGLRVLVVDDIATNRLVLRLLLSRAGAHAFEGGGAVGRPGLCAARCRADGYPHARPFRV